MENEMKQTAMQELLQVESDLTRMFDSDLRVAIMLLEYIRVNKTELLEKDKGQIENAYWDGGQDIPLTEKRCEQYYYRTFNTNEK
jgi:hypothetical protein